MNFYVPLFEDGKVIELPGYAAEESGASTGNLNLN
jgi:hypothetical protein